MVSFLVFFDVSEPTVAVQSPKSGYPSAESPHLDFELLFLVATTMQDEIHSQKWFCTVFYGASIYKTTETVASKLCPPKDCGR